MARTFELIAPVQPVLHEFRVVTEHCQMNPNSQNTPNHEFRVEWGGSGAFVAKNYDGTSWHELLN